jgi:hypothetical protein
MKNKLPRQRENKPAKSLEAWTSNEIAQKKTDRELKDAAEEKARIDAEQRKITDYIVFKVGEVWHRTPHLQEATNLARSTSARVFWAINGEMIGEVEINKSK